MSAKASMTYTEFPIFNIKLPSVNFCHQFASEPLPYYLTSYFFSTFFKETCTFVDYLPILSISNCQCRNICFSFCHHSGLIFIFLLRKYCPDSLLLFLYFQILQLSSAYQNRSFCFVIDHLKICGLTQHSQRYIRSNQLQLFCFGLYDQHYIVGITNQCISLRQFPSQRSVIE